MSLHTKKNMFFDVSKLLIFSGVLIADCAIFPLHAATEPFLQSTLKKQMLAQQPDPNRDRFLSPESDLPTSISNEPDSEVLNSEPTTEETTEIDDQTKISVEQVQITGSTIFTPETFTSITQPLEGRDVTVQELVEATNTITQLYLQGGYITSRAVLPEQVIADGIIQIQVFEGRIDDIQIDGLERLRSGYVRSRLQQAVTNPLNANRLEEQLRLLRVNEALFDDIRGRLEPGSAAGTSILRVDVQEATPWQVGLSADNYSPPSVGSERLGVFLAYSNLSGWGDTLSVDYRHSTTGGSNNWDLGYQLPVNPMDGTISLRGVFNDNEVTQDFIQTVVTPRTRTDTIEEIDLTTGEIEPMKQDPVPLDPLEEPRSFPGQIEGDSERYAIGFRQPLVRSLREEFALSVGLSYQDRQTFFIIPDIPEGQTTIDSRTSVIKVGQDYIKRDPQGVWALRSQFNWGTGLFDANVSETSNPDSQFFSWLGQVQRVQQLGSDNLLILQADLQLASDGLPPSEQFVIGGGQSLRGYRQNVRAGDNGFRVSIEDRITLIRDEEDNYAVLQIAPFADMGAIWNNSDNPNDLGDQNFLAGAGLGLLLEPVDGFNIRLDYAIPIVKIDDKGNNAQDEGFYFSVNYQH